MDEIVSNVYKTSDYQKFKTLNGNRFIDHSQKIVENIKTYGQLISPIIVNEKFEIIDGQNRFEAFKALNLPVMYIIAEGYNIRECVAMNNVSKNWTTNDYIKSYADLGNYNYVVLEKMLKKYSQSLPSRTIISVTSGVIDFLNHQAIKKGLLGINPKGEAHIDEVLNYLVKFDISGIKGKTDVLYKGFVFAYESDEIDAGDFCEKWNKYKYTVEGIVDTDDAIAKIEEVYNKRAKKNKYMFFSAAYKRYAYSNFVLADRQPTAKESKKKSHKKSCESGQCTKKAESQEYDVRDPFKYDMIIIDDESKMLSYLFNNINRYQEVMFGRQFKFIHTIFKNTWQSVLKFREVYPNDCKLKENIYNELDEIEKGTLGHSLAENVVVTDKEFEEANKKVYSELRRDEVRKRENKKYNREMGIFYLTSPQLPPQLRSEL